ncbi:MAG: hypothetical protein HY445_01660 [Candidatus Niyogibacteria bacterium]|nr:hypothetical protein [Candidatus Niyogibacteria bacterium]
MQNVNKTINEEVEKIAQKYFEDLLRLRKEQNMLIDQYQEKLNKANTRNNNQ